MIATRRKAQTALEYLISYGWMVLIIAVALAALYSLGIFNTSLFSADTCTMPASFGCQHPVLLSNGFLTVSLTQETGTPINITAIACATNQSLINAEHLTPAVYMAQGMNASFTVQCYSNGFPYSASGGTLYSGYLILGYTDLATLFNSTVAGAVAVKVKS